MAKNNSLDDIVKCNINISSPSSIDATFDSILLIVPAPSGTGTETADGVIKVKKSADLLVYGFTTTDAAYKACDVAFGQNPAPDSLNIIVRATVDDSPEDIGVCLARAAESCDFYGIHLTSFKTSSDVVAAAAYAEANEKLFGCEYTDYSAYPLGATEYSRTFAMYSGEAEGYASGSQPAENAYAALALMAKCFGYTPGSETWHLKELALIVQSALNETKKSALKEQNTNMYLRYANSNVTIGGYVVSGEWIDVIRFRDWLKANIQINVYNVLKANRKVPFTDAGIGLIAGALQKVLIQGQRIGGIAANEYDEDGNEKPGYTINVPLASSLTEAERKSRKLTGVSWTARLAGAIHAVEIEGYLTF